MSGPRPAARRLDLDLDLEEGERETTRPPQGAVSTIPPRDVSGSFQLARVVPRRLFSRR